MKLKKILLSFFVLASALSLTSCANYSAAPLSYLSPDLFQTASQEENVSVVSKTFGRAECKRFLDRDVIAEGYQPVQIYIQNDSDKNYIFSLNRISLPVARPEEVAEKVHTSTVGRAAGYGAGSLFFWPLLIPAIVDGVKSSKANKALDQDFFAKAARDQIIFPHSKLNAILFVPRSAYQSSYQLTLIDANSKQPKVFQVTSND